MIVEARPGDEVVFTYSGHGSSIPDDDEGEEPDGMDETLCPHDLMEGRDHLLVDDELAEIFGRKQEGVHLFFVSDSCHSGTVARFGPSLAGETPKSYPRIRYLPPATFLKGEKNMARLRRMALVRRVSRQKYPALLAAACADYKYSWDAAFKDRPNGAFTYVALQALKKNPKTPREWMEEIRKHLPSARYPQSPGLYGSWRAKSGPMF